MPSAGLLIALAIIAPSPETRPAAAPASQPNMQFLLERSLGYVPLAPAVPVPARPTSAYAEKVRKTFFVYRGLAPTSDEPHVHAARILVSCYDHSTGMVPQPLTFPASATGPNPGDPVMCLDPQGYVWIAVPAADDTAPGGLFKSIGPYRIDQFEALDRFPLVDPQIWSPAAQAVMILYLEHRQNRGHIAFTTSADGRPLEPGTRLVDFAPGYALVSGQSGGKIGVAFTAAGEAAPLQTNLYYMETTDLGKTWQSASRQALAIPLAEATNLALVREYSREQRLVAIKHLVFDQRGNPIVLYITSQADGDGQPRIWTIARWTGREWDFNGQIQADHTQDAACLYAEKRDLWRLIGATEPGPVQVSAGGQAAMWTTDDQGRSWYKQLITTPDTITHDHFSRPQNAHDELYALWTAGAGKQPGDLRLYYTNKQGQVFRLPHEMTMDRSEPACVPRMSASGTQSRMQPKLASVETFIKSPRHGVRVNACSFYTRTEGREMMSFHSEQTRSDTLDAIYQRFSNDNGRTWSEPAAIEHLRRGNECTWRRYPHPGFVDWGSGKLLMVNVQGDLPNDQPLEGMKHWTLYYALSEDGGRTFTEDQLMRQRGRDFSPEHPLPGVWKGKNSVMIGDHTCAPIRLKTGEILQPVQITPLGPDGKYHNPGGGYTYHDAAVMIGKWSVFGTLEWERSALVEADPARSTRGMLEPTIAQMPDGRVLMILRGSNDRKPSLPGFRWYAVSNDRGESWSRPQPWTYADGRAFYSPSSCSQLVTHSSGHIYWIGNLCRENPKGNQPRYPLVIAEVDSESMLLIEDSLSIIDDRKPGEPDWVAISNFYALEDRVSREILIHCAPLGHGRAADAPFDWTADALIYRVAITGP